MAEPGKFRRQASGRGMIRVAKQTADILENPSRLKEWDEEELRRGYRKSKKGNFIGRPPHVVPTACHQELTRRLFRQAQQTFNENLPDAVNMLMSIVKSPNTDDHAKLKAISMVLERTMGKTPERVDISMAPEEPAWIKAMRDATVVGTEYDPILEADDVIDVESEEAS